MIKTSEHKKTNCFSSSFKKYPLLTFQGGGGDAKGHNIHKKILSTFVPKDGWMDGNGIMLLQDKLGQSI